jgi:hypothetical protein
LRTSSVGLSQLAHHAGRAGAWTGARPFRIHVQVTAPDVDGAVKALYALTIDDDAVHLGSQTGPDGDANANITLPAEALLRLVYGRLDPDHTPEGEITLDRVDLDALRALFPGF